MTGSNKIIAKPTDNPSIRDSGRYENPIRGPPKILYTGTSSPYFEACLLAFDGNFKHDSTTPIFLTDSARNAYRYAVRRSQHDYMGLVMSNQIPTLIAIDAKYSASVIREHSQSYGWQSTSLPFGRFLGFQLPKEPSEDFFGNLEAKMLCTSLKENKQQSQSQMDYFVEITGIPPSVWKYGLGVNVPQFKNDYISFKMNGSFDQQIDFSPHAP